MVRIFPLRAHRASHIAYRSRNANHHRVREAFETSLAALNCEYIDLYLMHWPQAEVDGAYMIRARTLSGIMSTIYSAFKVAFRT